MARAWLAVLLLLAASQVWADTTANLITNVRGSSGTGVWIGPGNSVELNGQQPYAVYGASGSVSGSNPLLDSSTTNGNGQSGRIIWSYGQATVQQIIAINQALSGVGIQINGYNWSYELRNDNAGSGQGGTDTLTATSRLWNPNYSQVLLQESRTHNTRMDWTSFSSTVTASSPLALSSVGNLMIEFSSRDAGFWAGYYGPQIRNVQGSFNYTVDPCALNPLSSPTCAGYNDIVLSNNLVPQSLPSVGWNNYQSVPVNNNFAINTALAHSGAGVQVHGFQWGYSTANWWGGYPEIGAATVAVKIRDSNENLLYEWNQVSGDYGQNSYNFSYTLPASRNSLGLGTFVYTANTARSSSIYDMWARVQYTPDPCVLDPLSSASCPGYAAAYLAQQCQANPLYDQSCPGYAAAYFTQQCTANPLYASNCPGYAAAYLSQQCGINSLYDVSCPGYQQAYFDQQCGLNPLYDQSCSGYTQAYYNLQCSINPLYDNQCPGYQQAYYDQQCQANPLSDSGCPNYSTVLAATQPPAPAVETTAASSAAVIDPVAQVTESPASVSVTSPTSVSPAAVVSVVSPVSAPAAAPAASQREITAAAAKQEAQAAEKKSEQKKTEQAVTRSVPRGASPQAAARAAAERAEEAAAEAANATTIEAQQAAQNLVLGLMGYNPGFAAYQNGIVPDTNAAVMARQYNRPTVDNRRALRGLSGASDRLHQDMVDQQYGLGR